MRHTCLSSRFLATAFQRTRHFLLFDGKIYRVSYVCFTYTREVAVQAGAQVLAIPYFLVSLAVPIAIHIALILNSMKVGFTSNGKCLLYNIYNRIDRFRALFSVLILVKNNSIQNLSIEIDCFSEVLVIYWCQQYGSKCIYRHLIILHQLCDTLWL